MTWCLAMAYDFWFLRILQFWVQSCLCIFVIPIEMVRVFSSIRQVGWHVLKCSRKVAFFFCISQMFIEAKTDTSSLALSDVRGPMCACIACDHRYDILQWHFSFRSDIQQLHYLLPARHCFFLVLILWVFQRESGRSAMLCAFAVFGRDHHEIDFPR